MEESMFSSVLNFLSLGLSVVLLFAIAYLWSSNGNKTAQIEMLQSELKRIKKKLDKVEEKVNQIREPQVVSEVPQAAPFGIDLSTDNLPAGSTTLAPQEPWRIFVEDYNDLAADMSAPGKLKKCETFVREHKLRILTYSGSMTFRPAIDVKDSSYWAFKCSGEEFAVVPNPMNPCDEILHEHGGIKEAFALNYQNGVYKIYNVKFPALFTCEPSEGWKLKNPGVVDLERN